ncbi:hypothetical protein CU031_2670 [Enterococcus faecium]|nr:hypothetical protein [Enterococcus faecium]MBK4761945.1 hypothetical protein [Enterococcus faecium]MBK4802491.1 hypothetical protein [Enterococcus faecium]MBK4805207.1 hypothetical protein [Enterococcus faecium]MBK4818566.1 hypothetical protein [Enterococcus faecium]
MAKSIVLQRKWFDQKKIDPQAFCFLSGKDTPLYLVLYTFVDSYLFVAGDRKI